MGKTEITIEIDPGKLRNYTDSYLGLAWNVAQANPAPYGDKTAGELVERIGREIIRRWLGNVEPELWHHQGRDHSKQWLGKFAKYEPGATDVRDPEWENGVWVPRADVDAKSAGV